MVRVGTADGGQFIFSASDKQDMLLWIEALEAASHLDPSTMLLHSRDGVVVHTGYLDCQEFALESGDSSPLQSPPPLYRRLASTPNFSGVYSAVDYGRHWTVLKSSGLVQCLVRGRPETLFSLLDAVKVKVHNPREGREGGNYFISLFDKTSQVVLQAECLSDHFDWVLAVERVLQDKGIQDRLCGDRGNQSGYVTLKRLMMMQERGKLGQRGSVMQLYAMPRLLNTLDDVYDLPQGTKQDHTYENQKEPSPPVSPHSYVNFVPPPPIPPRGPGAPPLPPKGISSASSPPEGEILSPPDEGDESEEYVVMNPQSLPATPSNATHFTPPSPLSLPATPISAHHHHPGGFPSQPITIPRPRLPGKPTKLLLRSHSELSPSSPHTPSPDHSPSPSSGTHSAVQSQSLPRRTSSTSSSHPHTPSSSHRHTSTSSSSSLHRKHLISNSTTNGGSSSGYNSPGSSPAASRFQSNRFPRPVEGGDVMVGVATRNAGDSGYSIGRATSALRQLSSDGYCSSHSSTDEIAQVRSISLFVCVSTIIATHVVEQPSVKVLSTKIEYFCFLAVLKNGSFCTWPYCFVSLPLSLPPSLSLSLSLSSSLSTSLSLPLSLVYRSCLEGGGKATATPNRSLSTPRQAPLCGVWPRSWHPAVGRKNQRRSASGDVVCVFQNSP